jgi:hypothetical protein
MGQQNTTSDISLDTLIDNYDDLDISLGTLVDKYDDLLPLGYDVHALADWPVYISQKADAALGDDNRDARLEIMQAMAAIGLRKVGPPTATNEYWTYTAYLPPAPDGTIIIVHTRLPENLIIVMTKEEFGDKDLTGSPERWHFPGVRVSEVTHQPIYQVRVPNVYH